ncbi:hypothetical protein EIP91_004523 [Steccherinum ochraceum]|uniref:Uncharacterized protein n=1 Tax=Steccherinum ochraceum TaxID=92696 RepID=A0A4R0R8M2_9APHY|nr:hypothetical protein EIP91_004523 [Steccherinum ochraceum]
MSGMKGLHRLRANAISYSVPIPKVYDVLPPSKAELDEVLAFLYIGPLNPKDVEWHRTPFLVRSNQVRAALEWLILNHKDYSDMRISEKNLKDYDSPLPPVVVDWHKSDPSVDKEGAPATAHREENDGVEDGECPFVVHGITGQELSELQRTNPQKARAMAIKRFKNDEYILGIGHSDEPESLYNNPQLYPQMFPWLFPYGFGGFGNEGIQINISETEHKRWMLMYYDKRFQLDATFALIAFNHQQIKNCSLGSYLLAQQDKFDNIAERVLNVSVQTLDDIIGRLEVGSSFKPANERETECYQLLHDVDTINQHVDGSSVTKAYMRNELWALTSYFGAPSWYITLSPADVEHPIALYYADTKEMYRPELIRLKDDRMRLIANNPVAGARFFKFIVESFLTHVIGSNRESRGFYGKNNAYYGTVEQQEF